MKNSTITFEEANNEVRNVHLAYYVEAAVRLGISYEVLIPTMLVEFSKDNKKWRIHKSLTSLNDSVAMAIASYKNTSNMFLGKNGVAVPKQEMVDKVEDIMDFINETGNEDIVVKPRRGYGGRGISILPRGKEEIKAAYEFAEEFCLTSTRPRVLVEEFISGENYRIMVLGDKAIAAVHRIPAKVTGDGKSATKALVEAKNKLLKSKKRPLIPIDKETEETLESQSLTLDSIPETGQEVRLRFNANLSTGGSTRECLGEVHPRYLDIAIKANQLLGLKLGGVDLICEDITNPDANYVINEVNHDPGLRLHNMPDEGESADIALPIMKYMAENLC